MSAIDEVLNQFLAEGASGDWFARCDDARREIDNLRAENAAMRKALRDALRAWSFNDYQFHTHSWHTREDWIGRHPVVLEMARIMRREDERG